MKKLRTVLDFVRLYIRKGWRVVPIPKSEKAPIKPGWQKLRIEKSEVEDHFPESSNVGILLGKPSNNLIDVDLDCDEAILLAPQFLPGTARIHGRKSRPSSHRWYYGDSSVNPQKFAFKGKCLLEIRSTGQQTIVPPSKHPSGEKLHWESKGKPRKVRAEELSESASRLAAAVLLVRRYPQTGSRNEFALALAGMLQRAGWEEIEIGEFVAEVARAADDEQWRGRKAAARSTRKRMESGGPATGRPRLAKLIGRTAVDQVCEWLGISDFSPLVTKPVSPVVDWPKPLSQAAYHGVVGEIVNAIEPQTEADPAAILVQLLVAFGNCVGTGSYCVADGGWQRANIFALVVGQTSKARKGTSWAHVRRVMEQVSPRWAKDRIINGLSSGEGLITAVQDPADKPKDKKSRSLKKEDGDIKDKRALVCESEFSRVLRTQRREGNILSAVMRHAWDGDTLQTLTKNAPLKATNTHISMIGHITQAELRRELSATDEANGYANRFLFVCAKRSKELPMGGKIDARLLFGLGQRLRAAMKSARAVQEVKFTPKAEKLWRKRYSELSAARPGMLGAITSRGDAHVLRMALIYALLDGGKEIRTQHLKAALAVWRYCVDSARYIFGESLGDKLADRILHALKQTSKGMTRTEIRERLGRNFDEYSTNQALELIEREQLAKREVEETGGRPAERWFATGGVRHKRPK